MRSRPNSSVGESAVLGLLEVGAGWGRLSKKLSPPPPLPLDITMKNPGQNLGQRMNNSAIEVEKVSGQVGCAGPVSGCPAAQNGLRLRLRSSCAYLPLLL